MRKGGERREQWRMWNVFVDGSSRIHARNRNRQTVAFLPVLLRILLDIFYFYMLYTSTAC
jgi:hypothetical protein